MWLFYILNIGTKKAAWIAPARLLMEEYAELVLGVPSVSSRRC